MRPAFVCLRLPSIHPVSLAMTDVLAATKERLVRLAHRVSPVLWANAGPLSRWLARRMPTATPPVLVMAFPRSGSSWVGRMLGASPQALYLREPVTQTAHRFMPDYGPTVHPLPPEGPPDAVRAWADDAFAGVPRFPFFVIPTPRAWSPWRRAGRRVVVKEVNPLALRWMVRRYAPRVVYLVRHPAAVALSFRRLGWTTQRLTDYVAPATLRRLGIPTAPSSFWAEHAAAQAAVTRLGLEALAEAPAHRVVRYEALCADPVEGFRALYAFAGLRWTAAAEAVIRRHSAAPTASDAAPGEAASAPFEVRRASAKQAAPPLDALPPSARDALHDAYVRHAPPGFYDAARNWTA
jgi:hypothetical protein